MSQLLSRLCNLSSRNHSLMHKTIRLFSSSSSSPYCIIEKPLPGGGNIGDVVLFDPAKEELLSLSVLDKKIPIELLNADVIGASHGWGFYSDQHDRSLCISDYFNPLATKPNPTTIPLPMLTALYSCQTENVWNVAMSSSPDQEDEDLVVGIKFLGTQLSLCRPRRDLRWTNISTPFESFQNSNLMYSKRDQTFNLPAPGGNYLCLWDLQFHKDDYLSSMSCCFTTFPSCLSPSGSSWIHVSGRITGLSHPQGNLSSSNGTPVSPLTAPHCRYTWCLERKTLRMEEETCVTQRTLEICASSFQRVRLSASRLVLALVSSLSPFILWAVALLFTISAPKPPAILSTPMVHQ